MGKGEIAQNEQFRLFPKCFLPNNFRSVSLNLKLSSTNFLIWTSLKFVIWWRAKTSWLLQTFDFCFWVRSILTLSQTTNFRLFQTQRVCRRQIQIWWKWQKVRQTDRKHGGKMRNCSLRAISLFPTVFSKGLFCRHVKTRACLGKG